MLFKKKWMLQKLGKICFHNLKNYNRGFIYWLECRISQVFLEVGLIHFYIDLERQCTGNCHIPYSWYISKVQSVMEWYWEGHLDTNLCRFHRLLGILCFFSAYATNLKFRTPKLECSTENKISDFHHSRWQQTAVINTCVAMSSFPEPY